jgi:hypothetical protein
MSLENSIDKLTAQLAETTKLLSLLVEGGAGIDFGKRTTAAEEKVEVKTPPAPVKKSVPKPPAKEPEPEPQVELTIEEVNQQLSDICVKHFNGSGAVVYEELEKRNAAAFTDLPKSEWAGVIDAIKARIDE